MHVQDIRGAIFDVDDTLLDNFPDDTGIGLHDISRLQAAHEVGRRYKRPGLQALTITQADNAFRNAKEHSLRGAVWQMLLMAGEVMNEEIELDNRLLQEIMTLKEEIHEDLLRAKGKEKPGAIEFVKEICRLLPQKIAIASTANRRDIDIFLEISGLETVFPNSMIVSRENLTHPKPHPEAFDTAFSLLGLTEDARASVLAFEEDPRGIMSAKAAGLYVCAITGCRFDRAALTDLMVPPDLVADTYDEFAQLLGMRS